MNDNALPVYHLLHELDARFDDLMAAIDHAATYYEQQQSATWHFQPYPGGRSWLRQALLDMWHQQGQDGRETRNYIALIAADDELLEKFTAVNRAKAHISDLLQHIKQAQPNTLRDRKSVV